MEIGAHWFIGVHYHPELKSRPFEPHPLFASLVAAANAQSRPAWAGLGEGARNAQRSKKAARRRPGTNYASDGTRRR